MSIAPCGAEQRHRGLCGIHQAFQRADKGEHRCGRLEPPRLLEIRLGATDDPATRVFAETAWGDQYAYSLDQLRSAH